MIINDFLKQQSAQFRVFNTNARKLIGANVLYALFNPFFLIFSNTFIFASTKGDLFFNTVFCVFTFAGIVSGFMMNGYWLRVMHVKKILVIGSWFMFTATTFMFFVPQSFITATFVLIFGLFSGFGNGLYWSSRNYLTLVNTNDTNRDFFAGIDFILNSAGRVITPLIVGFYIGEGVKHGWFKSQFAYQTTLVFAFLLLLSMSIIVLARKYRTIKPGTFLNFRYSKIWTQVRYMTVILGLFQGALVAMPPVLIMKFVGSETAVGIISSLGYFLAITIVYIVSKRSAAEHRTAIVRFGNSLFLVASILYSITLHIDSFWSTAIFIVVMFITEPIINFPFRASFMKAIEQSIPIDKCDAYAYVVDVEIFAAFGRIGGLIFFYILYYSLPINYTLPIFMLTVALAQFIVLPFSKRINGK